jgi:hypothetical protein
VVLVNVNRSPLNVNQNEDDWGRVAPEPHLLEDIERRIELGVTSTSEGFCDRQPSQPKSPASPVQIIGFVQLFLNPEGDRAPTGGPFAGTVKTTVINMAGCATGWNATPILGNGASPVAVRLISPSS